MRVEYGHHAPIAGHLGNFGPSRQKDLEALAMMTKLSRAEGETSNSRLGRKLQLHRIAAEDHGVGLSGSSFTAAGWAFLLSLRDPGRAATDAWLASQSEHHALPRSVTA